MTVTDDRAPAFTPNAFERVTTIRSRPGYRVEPAAIAWNAVVFALKGDRDAVACIPRASLATFIDDLEAGRLDAPIREFLASPPAGRVLRNSDQTSEASLFDELGSPGAVVPPERSPGRPKRLGGAGGRPIGSRPHKRARRPRRLVVAAVVVVVALVGGGVALAASSSKSKTTSAVGSTPTGAPSSAASSAPEGGADLKVDIAGSFLHISGTFCGGAGQGHFDLSGQISSGGLSITFDGLVDLTLSPDGTGTYAGHMDVHPPVGAPLVNQLSGNAKVNRFDGNEAEIEVVDGTFNGNAGPGPSPLPFSRANPAHHAIPATAGTFC